MSGFSPLGATPLGAGPESAPAPGLDSLPIGKGPIGSFAVGGVVGATSGEESTSHSGSLSQTLDQITVEGQGSVAVRGVLEKTLGDVTVNAAGEVTPLDAPTDPYFSNVTLLMHCDDLKDVVSGSDATITGSTAVDTSVKNFGSGSLYNPGINNHAAFPDDDKWDLGTGPFTIEFWYNPKAMGYSNKALIGQWEMGGPRWGVRTDASGLVYFTLNVSGSKSSNKTAALTQNTWHAIAVTRDDTGAVRVYLNGSSTSPSSGFTEDLTGCVSPLLIGSMGAYSNVYDTDGYFDEIRITKGVARYTGSTYDLQTQPFGEGAESTAGALEQTLGDVELSASGAVSSPDENLGSLAATIDDITAAATATVRRRSGAAALFIGA